MPIPVAALSPEDVQGKLASIFVFAVVDERDEFYQTSGKDVDVIPLYLEVAQAQDRLKKISSSKEGSNPKIRFFRLNAFYKVQEQLQAASVKAGRKLVSRIVSPKTDMEKASEILEKQGLSKAQINSGLMTPVFYTEPMLSVKQGEERKSLFFLSYDQLDSAVKRVEKDGSSDQVVVKVADLSVVLKFIEQSKEDIYSFVTNEDGENVIRSLK